MAESNLMNLWKGSDQVQEVGLSNGSLRELEDCRGFGYRCSPLPLQWGAGAVPAGVQTWPRERRYGQASEGNLQMLCKAKRDGWYPLERCAARVQEILNNTCNT